MNNVIKSRTGLQGGTINCNGYTVAFETSLDTAETLRVERTFTNQVSAEEWLDLMCDAFKEGHSQLV